MDIMEKAYLHTRWQDQVDLEEEALAAGRQRVQDRINRAHEKKDLSNLRPQRNLMKTMVEPVAEKLEEWLNTAARRRGIKPVALRPLRQLPREVAALIALRSVFRMLGLGNRKILGLAMEIGAWLEHEQEALAWKRDDADSWKRMSSVYSQRGSNAAHQKRSRVSIFSKHIRDKIDLAKWTEEERLRAGLTMIDMVVQGTGRFHVVQDSGGEPRKRGRKKAHSWPFVIKADPELLDWLKDAEDQELVMWPVYTPTLIPPRPWDGPRHGGYWTPFVRAPFLIRFKASHETQKARAIDEYEAIDMPEVYSAINYIQNVPWRINQRVLDVAQEAWEKDLAIGGLPRKEAEYVRPRPEDIEKGSEEWKAWAKEAGAANTRNALRVSRFIGIQRAINMAERFRNEGAIYFPHMLDFRGRMYPIPSDLSTQGEDLHRGLLEFHDGKPLGPDGWQWLAISLANHFGVDKVDMQERIDWVNDRQDLWLAIAEDPLGTRDWTTADAPWQALAAVFDWVGFLQTGDDYVSHQVVRVDGSCNGIQHLSAMVLDEVGGASVNLLPGDAPRDIYQEVADILTERLKQDSEDGGDVPATWWLRLFNGRAPRTITKRPVMILPYGGTREAYLRYTGDWLNERDPDHTLIPEDVRWGALGYMVKMLWGSVSGKVDKAREVMKWLQDCSKIASESGLPLYWVTPAGFVVRHFYGEVAGIQIDTVLDGQRVQLRKFDVQPTLDQKAQATGIAPNFVHSMDASSLMRCATLMERDGVDSMAVIHDSYGTHAADMWTLYRNIREAFVQTYEVSVLDSFLEACKVVAGEDHKWPPKPLSGTLDLNAVRQSVYFFA